MTWDGLSNEDIVRGLGPWLDAPGAAFKGVDRETPFKPDGSLDGERIRRARSTTPALDAAENNPGGDSVAQFARDIFGPQWRDRVDPKSRAGYAAFGMPFDEAKARAESLGFATATAYAEWRTKLRADYAIATATPARPPATYLPIMTAFRTVSR